MRWKTLKEDKRSVADESYYSKAERQCSEGRLVLEVSWAQLMYSITVDLFRGEIEPEMMYCCMVYCDDRVEKYGHQIMRMTSESPLRVLARLYRCQQDVVLNHVLSERHTVDFITDLPKKGDR